MIGEELGKCGVVKGKVDIEVRNVDIDDIELEKKKDSEELGWLRRKMEDGKERWKEREK